MRLRRLLLPLAASAALVGMAAGPAAATHSWGGYHWARTSNPFTLKLGDNVSNEWDAILATTSSYWAQSAVLDTTIVPGAAGTPKRCRPTSGRVEVCNTTFGNTGWLGIASVWASGSGHITQGTVKLNDTYFNTPKYNTPAWRNVVSCQEVGHTLGLNHQDEDFTNADLNTCMDYSNNPVPNQYPNAHDYQMLESTYSHLDSTTTISASTGQSAAAAGAGNSQAEWGTAIRYSSNGKPSLFVRDVGNNQQVFTFVIWAE